MWFEIHLRQKIWRLLDWVVILVLGLPILIPSYLCYQGTIGPDGLNTAIRFIGAFLTAGAALAAANNAASALWLEREKGILDTLLVTPLEPNEILIAKWRGALLNPLGVYGWLAALWLAGSLTGGLHPTALLMLPLLLAAYVTLAASFGLAMSLRSASRAQAQLWTGLTIVSAGWGPIVGQLAVAQFGEYDWGNSPMKILTLFYLPLFVAGSYALYDDALLTFRRKYYRMAP